MENNFEEKEKNIVVEETPEKKEKKESFWGEVLRFAFIVFLIVIPIRIFIVQPFLVSGSSMQHTFEDSDYLMVDEISYKFNDPKRGEVIIFKFPTNTKQYLIKRVIGLPNETVEVSNNTVTIRNEANPDGFILKEGYIEEQTKSEYIKMTLKDDEYFVMGDNRKASADSRIWGSLNRSYIVGRALIRLLPLNKIDFFPGF